MDSTIQAEVMYNYDAYTSHDSTMSPQGLVLIQDRISITRYMNKYAKRCEMRMESMINVDVW